MRRIVFFSKMDLASHSMMEKIDVFFKTGRHECAFDDINDILELWHIIEYLENGFAYNKWTKEEATYYRNCCKDFKRILSVFFANLSSKDIVEIFEKIDFDFTKTFWISINKHGTYKNIEASTFKILTTKKRFYIREILKCKNVVDYFDEEITSFLSNNELMAEVVLDYFEANHDSPKQELFFPKSFSLKMREELILEYLDNDNANLNYVRLIAKSKDSENLIFTDKTRLKAKRLASKINDQLFNSEYAISMRRGVCLSEDQEELKKIILKDGNEYTSYSRKSLLENLDKVSLFHNFKSVFDFLDFQGCIDAVLRESEIDNFERTFIRSKNEFFKSAAFEDQTILQRLNFEIYSFFLDSIDISLEEVLEYYVNDYLPLVFGIRNFVIHMPTKESSILEKIRSIVPEFESLLEQYKLYVEDDEIDFELLQVSTKTTKLTRIPSLLERKYVYARGDEYKKIKYNFFDSMSPLFDYEKYGKTYKNFYHLLLYERIFVGDYLDYRKKYLQHFVENNYLKIREDGTISLVNRWQIAIIGYLYKYDVISYWSQPDYLRQEIDSMEKLGIVNFKSTLLNYAEQCYFDFYLNNRYSNGYWLRNKYVHGTNSHDLEEQESDYKVLLKLMVLLILKIEDDLQLAMTQVSDNGRSVF